MIISNRLSKKDRNALPAEQFAAPGKRKLPINDEHHTILAWGMVDQTVDLTLGERQEARVKIMARARELGIDTSEWNTLKSLSIECMSLNIGNGDHPNKMPFSGVLTKVEEPSDGAPSGSGGRRVLLSAQGAQRGLASLLGMGVNFTPSFDGHDVKNKIGLISSADVVGNDILIEGFIYAADFPETASLIKSLKSDLGFSFEAQRIYVEDMSAEVLRITDLTFTGAAILLKDKAAYKSTSLAATAENEDLNMTAEELKALLTPMLAEAVKPFNERMAKIESDTASVLAMAQASAKLRNDVEPLAVSLEAQATALEAAGINAKSLRDQAAHLRSEAAAGRKPTSLAASTEVVAKIEGGDMAAQIAAAVAVALKPMEDANKVLTDKVAASDTVIADLKAGKRIGTTQPERKTLEPSIMASLNRAGITVPEGDAKLELANVDKALQASGLDLTRRIMVKNQLERAGLFAA